MIPNRRIFGLVLPLLLLWSSAAIAQSNVPRGIMRSRPQEKCVVASWRLLTPAGRGAEDVHAYFFLPQDGVQQKVQILKFSPEPDEIITDKYGRKIAHFIVPRMEESRHVAVRWVAKVKIHHLEATVKIDPASPAGKLTDEIRKLYLVDKPYYTIHSEYIRDLVARIAPPDAAPLDRVRKIFRHLGENLRYELAGGWDTAEQVLKRGTGSCSEYTYCFIALCRASGIPARYVGSTVLRRPKGPSFDRPKHRWAEVFIEGYGWVQVDVLQRGSLQDDSFSIANRFLILGFGDGDHEAPIGWRYTGRVRARRSPRAIEEIFWCDTVSDAQFRKVLDAVGVNGGEKGPTPREAVKALARIESSLCIPFLTDYLHDSDPETAALAAEAICRLDTRCARNVRYDALASPEAARAMSAALETAARGRWKKPESGEWLDLFDGRRMRVRADPGHPFRRQGKQLVNMGGTGTLFFRHAPGDRVLIDLLFRHVGGGGASLLFGVGAKDLFLELPFGVERRRNSLRGARSRRGLYAVTEKELHRATVAVDGCRVRFVLDGRTVFDLRDGNVGPGRIGITVRGEDDAFSVRRFRVLEIPEGKTMFDLMNDPQVMDGEGWPAFRETSGEKEK